MHYQRMAMFFLSIFKLMLYTTSQAYLHILRVPY